MVNDPFPFHLKDAPSPFPLLTWSIQCNIEVREDSSGLLVQFSWPSHKIIAGKDLIRDDRPGARALQNNGGKCTHELGLWFSELRKGEGGRSRLHTCTPLAQLRTVIIDFCDAIFHSATVLVTCFSFLFFIHSFKFSTYLGYVSFSSKVAT